MVQAAQDGKSDELASQARQRLAAIAAQHATQALRQRSASDNNATNGNSIPSRENVEAVANAWARNAAANDLTLGLSLPVFPALLDAEMDQIGTHAERYARHLSIVSNAPSEAGRSVWDGPSMSHEDAVCKLAEEVLESLLDEETQAIEAELAHVADALAETA